LNELHATVAGHSPGQSEEKERLQEKTPSVPDRSKGREGLVPIREALRTLQAQGKPMNFSTVGETACASTTFLYDLRHADLAEEIGGQRE